jgi:hypothetical protein
LVKRKHDGSSYAEAVASNTQQYTVSEAQREKMEEISIEISKVSSLCDKIGETAGKYQTERPLLEMLHNINEVIRGLVRVQETLVKEALCRSQTYMPPASPLPSPSIQMVSLGTIPKKQRASAMEPEAAAQKEQVPPEVKRFRDAGRSAENSTLVFNLNMGKVPIMNTETISNKATMAQVQMAAELEENNNTSIPCEDTITAMDDILSVANNISFYGKKTRTYNNPKDKLSGSFCTVPVKYEFRDKETRIEAEKLFMEKCGAHCAIPYPVMLRECIKQVVHKVKTDYPNNQVKVQVDTQKLCLKVSRREKNTENPMKWNSYDVNIPLPKEALDIDIRTVPVGFKMHPLPPTPGKPGSPGRSESSAQASSSSDMSDDDDTSPSNNAMEV